jgi:hypothetical protein
MSKTITFVLATVIAWSIIGDRDALSMDLNQYRWKNRLLFIFAPDDGHSLLRNLESDLVAQPGEVSERDLIVLKIIENGPSFMAETRLDPQTAANIRAKFKASHERFTCILVGKDGGIKLRRNDPVRLLDIFELIDAMPMRQQEMRQNTKGKN